MKDSIRIYRVLFHFICFFFIIGCNKGDLDNKLIGVWSIDINQTVVDRNNWQNILSNILALESDFTCSGISFYDTISDKRFNKKGTWQSISKNGQDSIILNIRDNPMNGRYKIEFYRDFEKKLLKMRLSNDYIEFTCSKFLQNFDGVRE